MADDILLSSEEQDERARQWIKENAIYVIAGICLGIAAIFGVNKYKADKLAGAEQASALYASVTAQVANSNISDITGQIEELKNDFANTSYAAKSVLIRAKQLVVSGDLESAKQEFKWVMNNGADDAAKQIATLRLAKLEIYTENYSAASSLLGTTDMAGLDSHYAELKGDLANKQGQFDKAKEYYQQAIDSANNLSPQYADLLNNKINRAGSLPPLDPIEKAADESADTITDAKESNDG